MEEADKQRKRIVTEDLSLKRQAVIAKNMVESFLKKRSDDGVGVE